MLLTSITVSDVETLEDIFTVMKEGADGNAIWVTPDWILDLKKIVSERTEHVTRHPASASHSHN